MNNSRLPVILLLLAILPSAALAQTYVAGPGLGLAVPDNGYNGTQGSMLCNTIAVATGGGGGDTVATATVTVAMSHTFVGDLTIKLFSPGGTPITLVSRPGVVETADDGNDTAGFGENSNLAIANPLTYDDTAPNPSEQMGKVPSDLATGDIICAFAGSPCTYAPSPGAATAGNLGSLNGQSKVGNWSLCLGDSAAADTGTLDGWTLTLGTTPVELQTFSVD
ncbi:proprotein convertase P-domain-containing protein [Dokdonella sp.]|uniref:proprotein convertase P-domain-containing protein n=1 Tax=Dokdonella sp. TaxID=2291710 RepID=UPI002CFDCA23|nr:proprotein convertase P-domain-containing protein [Dokdonella sp.]HOX72964.1 proprotein convertase P-domain-containing protein [Dokdonella sp.]HPN79334.1 proprotein convertase P-domain-containing protein [Dokdonella sp.]